MAEEEVGFRLALKNRREVQHGINEVGDEFDRVGDEAARAGHKARTIGASGLVAFGKSGRIAGRAAVYGIGAVSAAVVGAGIVLTKLSKDSIGEAREAQKVGAVTVRQVRATGHAANISARGVGNLSSAISAKVGIDDEEIQSGANKILMYKNVQNQLGKGNKIFNRATRDAVDLSAVTGTLTTNSKLLGKVLNDPTRAITGLTKAGVKFTDQQIKQIGAFTKQGDLLGAQKIVLGQVEDRVGGVAAAQATWGEKASVSIGNIKESIGTVLLPELDKAEKWFVQKGTPVINGWVDAFDKRGIPTIRRYAGLFESRAIPAISDFYDEAKPVAESILPAIGTGLQTTADAVKVIAPRMKSIFDGFNNLPDWAKQSIIIGAGGAAVAKKLGAGSLLGKGGLLGNVASMAKPLPVVVTNPGFGGTGLPGGKPGTPIVPGGKPTLPGGGKLPGLLSTLGLGALVTYGSKDSHAGDHANPGPVGSEADFKRMVAEKDAYTDWWNTATKATRGINEHTRGVIAGIDQVDSRVGKAKNSTQQLLNVLTGVDKNWRPAITVDGLDPALAKSHQLLSNLLGLPSLGSYGNGLGVLASSGGSRRGGGKGGGKTSTASPRTSFPSVDQPTFDDDFFGSAGRTSGDIVVPIHIDGKHVQTVVVDRFENQQARR